MLVSGSSSAPDASYQWFGPPSSFQTPFLVPSCRLPVAFLLASCCFLQPSAGLPPAVLPAAFQPSCGLPTPAFLHASGRGVHACFRGASIGHEVCFRTAFHGRKASFQQASCVLPVLNRVPSCAYARFLPRAFQQFAASFRRNFASCEHLLQPSCCLPGFLLPSGERPSCDSPGFRGLLSSCDSPGFLSCGVPISFLQKPWILTLTL